MESESDVILADVNHYRVNELQAADRTLEQVVRFYLDREKKRSRFAFFARISPRPTSSASLRWVFITNTIVEN
jgi:light-independent protochlorophyllide reductase subunit B